MKNILILLMCSAIFCTACKKSKNDGPQPQPIPEPDTEFTNPAMNYRDVSGVSVGVDETVFFDFDQNGRKDMIFRTERHAYDMNTKSRIVYIVDSTPYCHLAIDTTTEYTKKLNKKDVITLADLQGYSWYNANSPYLMAKISANNSTQWEGGFKEPGQNFLPFHFTSADKKYLGWLEISTNLETGRINFHRVAISKEPVDKIYAGI